MSLTTVQTTTQFAFIDALKVKLDARLTDTFVSSAGIELAKVPKPDSVMIFGTVMEEAFAAHSNRRVQENYTVSLDISAIRPGANEAAMKAARDRVAVMLGEIEDELRANHTMDGLVLWSRIATVEISQGFGDNGRICVASITIAVRAYLTAS